MTPQKEKLNIILQGYTQAGYGPCQIKERLCIPSDLSDNMRDYIHRSFQKEKILNNKILCIETSVIFQSKLIYTRVDAQVIPLEKIKERQENAKNLYDMFSEDFEDIVWEDIEENFIKMGLMSCLDSYNKNNNG